MSSTETRDWTCPECGNVVQLPKFSLDPLACETCVASKYTLKKEPEPGAAANPLAMATGLLGNPLVIGAIVAAICLPAGFLGGIVVGYFAFSRTPAPVPQASSSAAHARSIGDEGDHSTDHAPEQARGPSGDQPKTKPGYKWVEGFTRKDGKKVEGYWRKTE